MAHVFRYQVAEPPAPGAVLRLSAEDSRHLVRVVRRAPGDAVEIVDPDGRRWQAVLVDPGPPAAVRVDGPPVAGPEPAPVRLYQALTDWGRLDGLAEKAAELGIEALVIVDCERVRRRPDEAAWRRRRERLGRVVQAASRQSGGGLPELGGVVAFDDVLAEIPHGEGFLLDPRGRVTLGAALAGAADAGRRRRVSLLVGPEAGFTRDEIVRARAAGLVDCRLGPTVLRAETAALVASALALDAVGRFGEGEGAR